MKTVDLSRYLADPEHRKEYLRIPNLSLPCILARIARPFRKDRGTQALFAAHTVAAGLLPILSVSVLAVLVNLPGKEENISGFLATAGVAALLFFLFTAVSSQCKHRVFRAFMDERLQRMRDVLSQYMRMDYGLYENAEFMDATGQWASALSGNQVGLEGSYHRAFAMGGTVLSLLLLGAVMAWINLWIPVIGIAVLTVSYLTQRHVVRFKFERRQELIQANRRAQHYNRLASDFRYGKDVRLFRMEERFHKAFGPLFAAYEKLLRAFTARELQLSFVEAIGIVLLDGALFLFLTAAVRNGTITTEIFIPLLTAGILFSHTLLQCSQDLAYLKNETMYVADVYTFLEANLTSETSETSIEGEGPVTIELDGVWFRYPGSDVDVLENCCLHIESGRSCALVGVNGAGKTTLVKLITGLYRPTKGTVRINGVDADTYSIKERFRLFGIVFQETKPLAFTVAENVAASDQDINRDRVEWALRKAGLWEKVASLPKGMDTPMLRVIEDDGAILSGGETQKLLIARALYRENTRVLILDEPTAALDALAEEKVYQEFSELAAGRTTLFISHRLASTRFCDTIAVLDGGSILQEGTHDALMKEDGLYRTMFETQGKYYQKEAAHGND